MALPSTFNAHQELLRPASNADASQASNTRTLLTQPVAGSVAKRLFTANYAHLTYTTVEIVKIVKAVLECRIVGRSSQSVPTGIGIVLEATG